MFLFNSTWSLYFNQFLTLQLFCWTWSEIFSIDGMADYVISFQNRRELFWRDPFRSYAIRLSKIESKNIKSKIEKLFRVWEIFKY